MSNSTKLITLRDMVQDLSTTVTLSEIQSKRFDPRSSLALIHHKLEILERKIQSMMDDEGKLAETSDEEDGSESGDFPSHLTVVETRRYGTQIRGGDLTVEVGLQNPDSVFPGMERHKDDWEQFYTADGQPKPYYRRNLP